MEKRNPHFALAVVKNLIETGRVRMTASAVTGANSWGLTVQAWLALFWP